MTSTYANPTESMAASSGGPSVQPGKTHVRPIGDLQRTGINVSDIKKLEEAGYYTIGQLLQAPKRTLVLIKGLSEAKVDKLQEVARKLDARGALFKTGLEAKEGRAAVVKITTGSKGFDGILGGGIETAQLTEVFGEFRTGKTQIAHTLCVTTQLGFARGGGQGKVVYIDTEGNFRPERIESIAHRFGLNQLETLDNIIVCRVYVSQSARTLPTSFNATMHILTPHLPNPNYLSLIMCCKYRLVFPVAYPQVQS